MARLAAWWLRVKEADAARMSQPPKRTVVIGPRGRGR